MLGGCSGSTPASAGGSPTAIGSATSAAAPSPSPMTPAAALAAALGPLAAAAAFESTVTVDGNPVTSLSGRSVGSASQLTVTTNGQTVEYIRVPPEAWARQAGGTWVLVDESQAPDNPLAALAAPLTLDASNGDASGTALNATYAAAALGLQGDPVPVSITIDSSGVTFRYQVTNAGHQIVSMTVIRAASPTPQVTPPI